MLTTIALIASLFGIVAARADFDCEKPADLGCVGANAGHGCCKECIKQIVEDNNAIKKWVSDYKAANPGLSDAAIDKVETPDRLDWGHKDLKNCFFCAGQCWNNAEDNISCQVSMKDPFGDMSKTKKRSDISHVAAMQQRTLKEHHPEVAAAIANGNALLQKRAVEDVENVENVLAMCSSAELNEVTIIVPGFGKRYHCDQTCLTQFASKAPTPAPTPHPGQVGFDHEPTMMPLFSPDATPGVDTVPTNGGGNNPSGSPIIIGTNSGGSNQVAPMGKACAKDNEVCGMAGNTKLFCKCKVCGFKGTVCSASTSAVSSAAVAIAALLAVMRLF